MNGPAAVSEKDEEHSEDGEHGAVPATMPGNHRGASEPDADADDGAAEADEPL